MAWIGKWLFGVGVIHLLFGFIIMQSTLAVLWLEGVFNTVNDQPDRVAVFWFLNAGFLMLMISVLINQLERRGLAIPLFVTLLFCVLTIFGIVVMPLSGTWLLLPPAAGMVFRHIQLRKIDSS